MPSQLQPGSGASRVLICLGSELILLTHAGELICLGRRAPDGRLAVLGVARDNSDTYARTLPTVFGSLGEETAYALVGDSSSCWSGSCYWIGGCHYNRRFQDRLFR